MKFKKIKYNIIFVTMFILIAGVLGIQIKLFLKEPVNNVPQNDIEDIEPPDDQDDPTGPGDKDDNQDSGNSDVEPEEEFDPKMSDPSFIKFPNKMLNYCLDKLYQGQGYKADINMTLENSAHVMGGAVDVTQNVSGKLMKSGNKGYEEYNYSSAGYAGMGANFLKAFYFEDDSVVQYITPSGVYDIGKAQVTNMSRAEYNQIYGYAFSDAPYLTYNTKKFNIEIDSKKTKTGVEYYIITAINTDISSVSHDYTKYYECTGDLKNTKYLGGSYTYYIYKESGQIFRIQKEENMQGTNPAFGVSVTTKITSKIDITTFNKSFDINKPL